MVEWWYCVGDFNGTMLAQPVTPDADILIIYVVIDGAARLPANTSRWPYIGMMLAQRRRRWANISPALGKRLVFVGHVLYTVLSEVVW